jgi:carboxypeptidase Taq
MLYLASTHFNEMKGEIASAYRHLLERMRNLITLRTAAGLLRWDMRTMMPPAAISLRSEQLSLLERLAHRMATAPELGRVIDEVMKHPDFDSLGAVEKRNVELAKKTYDEATALPEELVAETAKQRAVTVSVWEKAKAAKDYKPFKPELGKLLELRRRAAELLMEVKKTKTPYDALLDYYEPKTPAEVIDRIFRELRSGLVRLIDRCLSAEQPDTSFLRRKVPVEVQKRVSKALAEFVGYDISSEEAWGRIDESEHPFTSGYYDDVRITTHYYEDFFVKSMYSVLHECGHAIYEKNLPREWMYQPVGEACSMGFHESQSRFVENIVGRSPEFLDYFYPQLKKLTGILDDVELWSFVRAVNKVEPGKIRVRADEATYGLHIIIRFELEQDLFEDRVTVEELPGVWNEKYSKYLGVEVEHDAEGVMQDIHWAGGAYGYFPSYALGNLYGGQLLEAMEKDLPDWRSRLAEGSFREIGEWLRMHIHRYGNLYDPQDLIKMVTGSPLKVKPFLRYLEEKYSKLYGF